MPHLFFVMLHVHRLLHLTAQQEQSTTMILPPSTIIWSRVVTGVFCCSPQVHMPMFPSSETRKKDRKMIPCWSHSNTDKAHGQTCLLWQSLVFKIKLKKWALHTGRGKSTGGEDCPNTNGERRTDRTVLNNPWRKVTAQRYYFAACVVTETQ